MESQKIINFDIPAALTALGILGLGLIFTTLPLLQNIAAGIVLTLGRPFKEDDIVELVTDKATFNVPAGIFGVMKEICVKEGQEAKIGEVLAVIDNSGNQNE